MSAAVIPARNRSRLQLVLLAALFAAPVVAGWVAWKYVTESGAGSTTNAGELVVPARPLQPLEWTDSDGQPLPQDLLTGRWSYVMLAGAQCDAACGQRLFLTRQIRTSVNKDMSRVQRVLVFNQAPADTVDLRAEHPDLIVMVLDEPRWRALSDQFGDPAASGQTLFLVDPLGNLMMRYRSDVPAKGVLKDLRKLLKVSQVG